MSQLGSLDDFHVYSILLLSWEGGFMFENSPGHFVALR